MVATLLHTFLHYLYLHFLSNVGVILSKNFFLESYYLFTVSSFSEIYIVLKKSGFLYQENKNNDKFRAESQKSNSFKL